MLRYRHTSVKHCVFLVAFLVALLSVFLGCCSSTIIRTANATDEALNMNTEKFRFIVFHAETFERLSDVEMSIINSDGTQNYIGKTDGFGVIYVDAKRVERSIAVVFCKNHFFCGAFLTNQSNFKIYKERSIHLAPFFT